MVTDVVPFCALQVVFALNQTLNQHESIRAGEETPSYTTDDLIRHYNCGDLDEVIFRRDSSQIPVSRRARERGRREGGERRGGGEGGSEGGERKGAREERIVRRIQ